MKEEDEINSVSMSFPRKRESRQVICSNPGRDSRFRGNDNLCFGQSFRKLGNLRMRKMIFIFHLSYFIFLFMAGCNPYEFHMGGPHVVDCVVITGLHGVDQGGYAATLRDTAAVDLNYFGATQYNISMGIMLKRGEGFRIMMRPVVEQHNVRDSGIIV